MKLGTIHLRNTTRAAVDLGSGWRVLDDFSDVRQLLQRQEWRKYVEAASSGTVTEKEVEFDSLIPDPGKVICVGLNYASHIEEMGRDKPLYPTLFAKYSDTLTGPFDPITAVAEDSKLDWEGELVVVIGEEAHRVSEAEASSKIAGYTLANDISMRDWQFRTKEWLQGKIWARSTPVGPYMITSECFDYHNATLRTRVNGEIMQEHSTGDLVFPPEYLVSYISTMIPLRPGDLILTGTPGGVGRARDPQVYLEAGDVVEVEVEGIMPLRSEIVAPE